MIITQSTVDALKTDGKERLFIDDKLSGFGVRITKSGTKTFIAQGRLGKRTLRVPIGRTDKLTVAEARRLARTALGDIAQGRDPRRARQQRMANGVSFGEFADRWLRERIEGKRSPKTLESYQGILKRHVKPAIGTTGLDDVQFSDLQALHLALRDKPRTANFAVGTIRTIIGYAEKLGLRQQGTNPGFKFDMHDEQPRERFLSDEELRRVADAIDELDGKGLSPWTAAAIRLLMLTGARSSEIRAMKWEHIDRERGLAILPTSKNKSKRTIYLNAAALQIIDGLPRRGCYVIAGNSIDVMCGALTKQWEKVRKLAEVEDVNLHDLRHTYASAALADGLPLALVGRLLGHKSQQATARYAHLASDPLSQAAHEVGSKIAGTMRGNTKATGNVRRFRKVSAK